MRLATFKKRTIVTLDATLDGEELEWTLNERLGDSEDHVTLESGDITFAVRRADLVALLNHVGYPSPPPFPAAQKSDAGLAGHLRVVAE